MSLTIRLAAADDVDTAIDALARLLARGVPPDQVRWDDGTPRQADLFDGGLFGDDPVAPAPAGPDAVALDRRRPAPPLGLPPAAEALLRQALMHADPGRFVLAHGYASRLRDRPPLWLDRLQPERLRLERMAREVGREIHKMHAFVRFRPVSDPADPAAPSTDPQTDPLTDPQTDARADDPAARGPRAPRHVAWFEPAHPIVRAAAPFFQRRFAAMRWAILTPWGSVQWEPAAPGQRSALQFGPPARREDAPPADAGEALWLAYYRSTFNPARANAAMMCREMPQRYWPHLPEAALIAPLLRDAASRTGAMLDHAADTGRRLPRRRRSPSA